MCRVTTWWDRLRWNAGTGPGTAMRQLTAQPASRSSAVIPSKQYREWASVWRLCLFTLLLNFFLFPLVQLLMIVLLEWAHYVPFLCLFIFYLATACGGIHLYSPNRLGPDIPVGGNRLRRAILDLWKDLRRFWNCLLNIIRIILSLIGSECYNCSEFDNPSNPSATVRRWYVCLALTGSYPGNWCPFKIIYKVFRIRMYSESMVFAVQD